VALVRLVLKEFKVFKGNKELKVLPDSKVFKGNKEFKVLQEKQVQENRDGFVKRREHVAHHFFDGMHGLTDHCERDERCFINRCVQKSVSLFGLRGQMI
jgi:hypothetical protein